MKVPLASMFVLFPIIMLVAFSAPIPVTSTAHATSERTVTTSYTTTAYDTTFMSTMGNTIMLQPASVAPQVVGFMAPKGRCSYDVIPITVESGTRLRLELTSTNPANLYLLASESYQTSSNECNLMGDSLLEANNFTDYKLSWIAPQSGDVFLLLTGPSTIIMLRDTGSTNPVEQFATITYAKTDTSVEVDSSTITKGYTTTTQTATSKILLSEMPIGSSVAVFILLLLGPALLWGSFRFLNIAAPRITCRAQSRGPKLFHRDEA